jgi:hypothetical protein
MLKMDRLFSGPINWISAAAIIWELQASLLPLVALL